MPRLRLAPPLGDDDGPAVVSLSLAERVAELLVELPEHERVEALASILPDTDLEQLERDWRFWSRPEQQEPLDLLWAVWVILTGRGWGKTRTGAEWVIDRCIQFERAKRVSRSKHRVALLARTAGDARDTMVEGDSGLAACCEQRGIPYRYEPSKRRFSIPSLSSTMTTFSAAEPDQLRGPQHHTAWGDEVAAWQHIVDAQGNTAWTNLMFGLRLDAPEMTPRAVATTTPKPIPLVREWDAADREGDRTVYVTRGSLLDNRQNLAPSFLKLILGRFEGSALAAQEIHGLLLDSVEGALWSAAKIAWGRVVGHPDLALIVVGVDPPAEHVAECGIVVVGIEHGRSDDDRRHAYVLEDASMHGTPEQWAAQVVAVARRWGAIVVGEVNQGGDMVRAAVHAVDPDIPFEPVRAGKGQGKWQRAEPVAALYGGTPKQVPVELPTGGTKLTELLGPDGSPILIEARIHHVGYFPDLESQMSTWTDGDPLSPDRMDALVWAVKRLLPDVSRPAAEFINPNRTATLQRGAATALARGPRIRR